MLSRLMKFDFPEIIAIVESCVVIIVILSIAIGYGLAMIRWGQGTIY